MKKNKKFENCFKNTWPYVTGAILLSIIQIITLAMTGNPWGITSAFAYWSTKVIESCGGTVYVPEVIESVKITCHNIFLQDPVTIRNIGIIVGAMLAAFLASHFRVKKIKSKKQIIGAVIGGLCMGYGSSIALGCNIGAFYSGLASMSLSGWIFGLFLFLGAIIGGKLLIRFLM